MFHVFPLVCLLIYGVNRRQGQWKGVKSEKIKYFRWFAVSTCPPGQVLAGPDMTKVRVLVKSNTFRVQN